ncbi:MAG: motility protein A, partial [Proteobacteria bacterium]|nr:motility protein A [Pseudomonadota bacterium]
GVVYSVVLAKGGDFSIFTNITALLVCVGGTVAATTLSSSGTTVLHALSAMGMLFWSKSLSGKRVANQLVALSRQARANGVASINLDSLDIGMPFFVKGIQLLVDNAEPERIEELMRLESEILSDRRRSAERMFRLMGTYSPMFGLVGTLIGLIQMLKDLTDPRAIGQGMSVALMATFYGVLFAGLIFLPLAGKIRTLDLDERLVRDEMLAGILAIRLGHNPEVVRETVEAFRGKSIAP